MLSENKKKKGRKSNKYPNKADGQTNKDYESSIPKMYEFENERQKEIQESSDLSNEMSNMSNMTDLFGSETSNPSDVVKELFSGKNPKLRTDLTQEQISIIARLYFLSKEFDMPELEYFCNEFIVLRISKDRLSRKEFVEAHRLNDDANKKAGIFSGFTNMFNRG